MIAVVVVVTARMYSKVLAGVILGALCSSQASAFSPSLPFASSRSRSIGLRPAAASSSSSPVRRAAAAGVSGLYAVADKTKEDHAPTAMNWEDMSKKPWGSIDADFMAICKADAGGEWSKHEIVPFGPIQMSPKAGVLNYGQGIFEGMKAQRTADGRIVIFRWDAVTFPKPISSHSSAL